MSAGSTSPEALATEPGGYVRSFNRFEFKYVLPESRARALIAGLEGYARPDAHSRARSERASGGYPIHSVYWDSPQLTFFWEKIDGEKYRRKLRFRSYPRPDGRAPDELFVEIKQRIDRTVQKRRARLSLERARALFEAGAPGAGALESELRDPVLAEALFLCRYHGLEPKMAVAYRREAYFGVYEQDLRITFDRRLQYDPHTLDLGRYFESGKYILPADQVVIEIKFNDTVPLWLTKLAQTHGLELVRMSKYCSAVDRAWFGGQLT